MQLKDVFKRLGYPKHTDAIYEVLSRSETPLLVTAIAQSAEVSRVVVYRALKQLEHDGLVLSRAVGKRTYYTSTSPHKLMEVMRCTEEESQALAEQISKAREKDMPRNIRFLYGAEGIRAAFDDVIEHTKKGDTFFRYTSERDLARVNRYLARDYRLRRDKKHLERLVISNPFSGTQKRSRLERFIKYIPADADHFEQNIIQLVYGNRVSIIDLNTETVTVIENKQLADFQKVIFKLLYKRLS